MRMRPTTLMTDTPLAGARHLTSGLNTRFNGGHLPFEEYVALNRNMITQAHSGVSVPELDKIVNGNAPFQLRPSGDYPVGHSKLYRRGILLTHGLTDSPYFMRHLATFFQKNGFRVMAILLPGHGTQPGDLLQARWQEWAKAVAYGTDQLAAEVDEVHLAGYSAGCALSIYQSLHDPRVRSLFLFSPALEISPRAARANWHKMYSWLIPSAQWLNIKPDKDIYKYESFPKNAAAQMHALTRTVNAQLAENEPDIPVFAAASQDDTTAISAATIKFMAHTRHPSSKLVLYTSDIKTIPQNFPADKLELVNSVIPAQKILSASHTSVVLPPEDAHYGAAGDYSNCIHYFPHDMEKYNACMDRPSEVFQGEINKKNLETGTLRRLMTNPNFAALTTSMRCFIDKL